MKSQILSEPLQRAKETRAGDMQAADRAQGIDPALTPEVALRPNVRRSSPCPCWVRCVRVSIALLLETAETSCHSHDLEARLDLKRGRACRA